MPGGISFPGTPGILSALKRQPPSVTKALIQSQRSESFEPRRAAAGVLLAATIVAAVAHTLSTAAPAWLPGLFAWAAGVSLWPHMSRRSKRQASALFAVGVAGMTWGAVRGAEPEWIQAVAANSGLIALLAAVSFLRLITRPETEGELTLPAGRGAVASTLVGVHLFGSVINLSTVFLLGERMALGTGLDSRQVRVLTRGFSAAAFWSPFFAAMAAALTFAPQANIGTLVGVGLPLAGLSLLITYLDISREGADDFRGYPMHYGSLWLPGLLAGAVVAAHLYAPDLSVLGLISLLAPLVTLGYLMVRGSGVWLPVGRHVVSGLPRMGNELALFLAAGVMAAGLSSAFGGPGDWLPFAHFGGLQAVLVLLLMVAVSIPGVHPVISIAAVATLLKPLHPDPNLLALTFLSAWAIGVSTSPLSGLNLAIQGAYGVSARNLFLWNLPYALRMLAVVSVVLYGYARLNGLQ